MDELRNVLNATLEDKAALASQCSALEAQVCTSSIPVHLVALAHRAAACKDQLPGPAQGNGLGSKKAKESFHHLAESNQCPTQAAHMEAGSMQLRAWLEEVISANEALEARVEAMEASAAAADHERAALEGWVRGSVQEQAAASTRLASFQVGNLHLECSE